MREVHASRLRFGAGAGLVAGSVLAAVFATTGPLDAQVSGEPRPIPYVNHVVQPGETLSKIAETYYGDRYQWPRIHECNRWLDPHQLQVGTTICIPNPTQGTSAFSGILEWFKDSDEKGSARNSGSGGGGRSRSSGGSSSSGSTRTRNPGASTGGGSTSWKQMIQDILNTQAFGRPVSHLIFIVIGWFMAHMIIQGGLMWFFAHVAFVKEVTAKKAWTSAARSEMLALVVSGSILLLGLFISYMSSPEQPVVPNLLMHVEELLSTPTAMAIAAGIGVLTYAFLGVRFVPQAFGAKGSQGLAIVFLAVLVPHGLLAFFVCHRLGFI